MSDTLRAVALLLSLVMWSPVAMRLVRGEVAPDKAVVLYAAALLIALVGCALVAAVVRAYAPEDEPPPDEVAPEPAAARGTDTSARDEPPLRRTEDAVR